MPATLTRKKVLLALSGGVDSSVALALLQEQGYLVEAVVLEFSQAHKATVVAATNVAKQLGVPLHVIECHAAFFRNVITPFAQEYKAGRTPNPCILCNPSTKFHLICEKAKELGFDFIATGHYARVDHLPDGSSLLRKADCLPRDQSYMLYRLTQEQLSMLLLPLQALEKSQVREIAVKLGLASAHAPDSQEICWLPNGDYPAFIESHFGASPPGDFISPDGTACGRHRGLLHYTIGQRKHLGLSLGEPVFIKEMNPLTNQIFLARSGEEYSEQALVTDCVFHKNDFLYPGISDTAQLTVKIRSCAADASASICLQPGNSALLRFAQPQRACAPGQSCVFYHNDIVLGGGFLRRIRRGVAR